MKENRFRFDWVFGAGPITSPLKRCWVKAAQLFVSVNIFFFFSSTPPSIAGRWVIQDEPRGFSEWWTRERRTEKRRPRVSSLFISFYLLTFFFFFFLTVFSCSRQRRLRCQQHHKRDCGYEENGDRRRCCVALRPYNKNQKNISSAGRAAVGTHTASDIAADFSRCSREIWSRSSWTTIMIAPSLVSFLSLSLSLRYGVYTSQTPALVLISFWFPGLLYSILSDKKKQHREQRNPSSISFWLQWDGGRKKKKKYVGATLQRENQGGSSILSRIEPIRTIYTGPSLSLSHELPPYSSSLTMISGRHSSPSTLTSNTIVLYTAILFYSIHFFFHVDFFFFPLGLQ